MTFRIGDTDFHLDLEKSSAQVVVSGEKSVTLNIDLHGDSGQYDRICDAPESPWASTLYPPRFYAYQMILKRSGDGSCCGFIRSSHDADSPESALYFMDHHELVETRFVLTGNELQIEGIVMMNRGRQTLHIVFRL